MINITLLDEQGNVVPSPANELVKKAVEAKLEEFSRWLEAQSKGGALSRPERAILDTFLAHELGVVK